MGTCFTEGEEKVMTLSGKKTKNPIKKKGFNRLRMPAEGDWGGGERKKEGCRGGGKKKIEYQQPAAPRFRRGEKKKHDTARGGEGGNNPRRCKRRREEQTPALKGRRKKRNFIPTAGKEKREESIPGVVEYTSRQTSRIEKGAQQRPFPGKKEERRWPTPQRNYWATPMRDVPVKKGRGATSA